MKPKHVRAFLILAASALMASCGSVTTTKPAGQGAGGAAAITKTYGKVLVKDFTPGPDSGADAAACLRFSTTILSEIQRVRPGISVQRTGTADAGTLVVGGEITRYVEGNAALRLLIGMGAGSSYFDATIRATDGATGAVLSTLKADKNSWGLGGSLAAAQTVDTFMAEAARKTAQTILPYLK